MKMLYHILFSRMGLWRSNLIWHLIGWTFLQSAISHIHTRTLDDFYRIAPWQLLCFTSCALLLTAFGPRFITLLWASFSVTVHIAFIISNVRQDLSLSFPAAEFLNFFALPVFCSCVAIYFAIIALKKSRSPGISSSPFADREVDLAFLAVFRLMVITSLFFVGLAKLNTDFFDPTVSCVTILQRDLKNIWRSPVTDMASLAPAWSIALGEFLLAFVLLLSPRLGILHGLLLFTGIHFSNALAVTSIIWAQTFAFFASEDYQPILNGLKKFWSWILLILTCGLIFSFAYHISPRPWHQYALYEIIISLSIFSTIFTIINNFKQNGFCNYWANLKTLHSEAIPKANTLKCMLIFFFALSAVNGLAPYMGLKFQYSLAMLSNLRTDNVRWNSLVIGKWIKIFDDPYIVVEVVHKRKNHETPVQQSKRRIERALYAPHEFINVIEDTKRNYTVSYLHFNYKGETFKIHSLEDEEFNKWLNTLPKAVWFQPKLSLNRPQRCTH